MSSFIQRTIHLVEQERHILQELNMAPSKLIQSALTAGDVKVGVEYEMAVKVSAPIEGSNDIENLLDISINSVHEAATFFKHNRSNTIYSLVDEYVRGTYEWDKWSSEYVDQYIEDTYGHIEDSEEYSRIRKEVWEDLPDEDMIDSFLSEFPPTAQDIYDYSKKGSRYEIYLPFEQMTVIDASDEIINSLNEVGIEPIEFQGIGYATYILETDESIVVNSADEFQAELISPPQSFAQTVKDMKVIQAWAQNNARTNSSTGLHINVSIGDFDKIDWFKLILLLGDEHVLSEFGRSNNIFTSSSKARVMSFLNNVINQDGGKVNLDSLASLEKYSESAKRVLDRKYQSVHLRKGYVEFRSPGGDWIATDVNKLLSTVARFIVVMKISADRQAYASDYIKKAAKFFDDLTKNYQNPPTTNFEKVWAKYYQEFLKMQNQLPPEENQKLLDLFSKKDRNSQVQAIKIVKDLMTQFKV